MSPGRRYQGVVATNCKPEVALLILRSLLIEANTTSYGIARSLPASRSLKLALPNTSIGPATSKDCAVGVASTTTLRTAVAFSSARVWPAFFGTRKI
jgi:hypothetical protein